jgi:S1-C subfamily serine protease
MPIELRILSGARAGQRESFEKSVIAIGRHPMNDFRFDPQLDLDVSARHGEIRCVDGRYSVHDSNSTNGTFVNGERVAAGASRDLRDSDVIAFGANGPTVSIGLVATPVVVPPPPATEPSLVISAPPAAKLRPAPSPLAATLRPAGAPPRGDTTERVAVAVRQQTRGLRLALVATIVVFGAIAATLFFRSARQSDASRAEIARLLEQNETITKSFQARLRSGDTAIANRMRHINDSLVDALRRARSAAQMAEAEAALRKNHDLQRQITDMDFTSIATANDPAVVMIVSDMGGPTPIEATGFSVAASGLIVTNRHVVIDSGARASSIKLKFANSGRWYTAHVAKLPDAGTDLALLQIDERGKFPAITKLAPTVDTPVGASVATIGFPLGTDLPMDGSAAKTSTTFGNVSKVVPELLQIDAYASHGSSGSPVFDGHGHVVGIVWGGPPGAAGRIVFAVPVDRLNELLRGNK